MLTPRDLAFLDHGGKECKSEDGRSISDTKEHRLKSVAMSKSKFFLAILEEEDEKIHEHAKAEIKWILDNKQFSALLQVTNGFKPLLNHTKGLSKLVELCGGLENLLLGAGGLGSFIESVGGIEKLQESTGGLSGLAEAVGTKKFADRCLIPILPFLEDDCFRASSSLNKHPPSSVKTSAKGAGWMPAFGLEKNSVLQVNLGEPHIIVALELFRRSSAVITTFRLSSSIDGINFEFLGSFEPENGILFSFLEHPVCAQYLRFHIVNFKHCAQVRMEIFELDMKSFSDAQVIVNETDDLDSSQHGNSKLESLKASFQKIKDTITGGTHRNIYSADRPRRDSRSCTII